MYIGLDLSRSPQRYAKLLRATGRREASPLPALMAWALAGDAPPGLSRVQRWAGPGGGRGCHDARAPASSVWVNGPKLDPARDPFSPPAGVYP